MKRVAAVVSVALLSLTLALAVAALLWFRWAQHQVAAHMRAPELTVERKAAPEMQFQTLDGRTLHLAQQKGKVVFLDLWGTWCVQCVAEMPTVQKLYDHYRNDPAVQLLIVSRMDSPAQVRTYAARNGYTLPFFRMRDEDIPATMQLNQFPSTFILDKQGRIVVQHLGAADWSAQPVYHLIDQLKSE